MKVRVTKEELNKAGIRTAITFGGGHTIIDDIIVEAEPVLEDVWTFMGHTPSQWQDMKKFWFEHHTKPPEIVICEKKEELVWLTCLLADKINEIIDYLTNEK